jgi:hypothetical protein
MIRHSTLPGFVTRALLSMANAHMHNHRPDQILSEYGAEYMKRWFLEKDRSEGSVYIHRILRSDYDEELHDHPGDNMTILLDGEIDEQREEGLFRLEPGAIVIRKAEERHRLLLERPVTTLWIMGERVRQWGFWTDEGDFVPSEEFFRTRSRPIA